MEAIAKSQATTNGKHKRRALNAIIQPFLQFKMLLYMLGSTVVVAILLGTFLYFAFSDLFNNLYQGGDSADYYSEIMDVQLVHLLRYSLVLFVIYIVLLAVVCITYTHKLLGPLQPFNRHIDSLIAGDYSARVKLRKNDVQVYYEYAEKLNKLAEQIESDRNS